MDAELERARAELDQGWSFLRQHEDDVRIARDIEPIGTLRRIALDVVLLEIDFRDLDLMT